jgi:predicted nucleic acid-binding protein
LKPAFIVDCSIAMAWCFSDETTPATAKIQDRLEKEAALVPAHWFLEVTNVLSIAERRKRITPAQSTAFLTFLDTMDIEVDGEASARAFAHLLPLCRSHGLTSYDAAYLELALRRGTPLASLDNELRAGAKALGVELLGR